MQFRHTIVLALAAIMAVSCITVDKKMGEDLVPGNQSLPVSVAEIDVPVQLKSSQPLQTLSTSEGTFGAIRTEEFGLVEFASVADLYPTVSGWDFGEDPIVKGIYLLANISAVYSSHDQQEGIPQQVFVHRTYKNVDSTTIYNSSFTAADYDPTPLNTGEVVYFGTDSLKIHLNPDYAKELLTATEDERDTVRLFAQRFKGLLVRTNTPDEGTYGGRENLINFGTGALYITINFQPTWKEGLSRKDTIFSISYGRDYCLNLSSYESDKLQNDSPEEDLAFEGAAGLKPYIDKDDLKQAIENWKTSEGLQGKEIIVAKAALVFPFEIPDNLDMTTYPNTLYPCVREFDTTYNANLFFTATDINAEGLSLGTINRSLCEYRMDIPSLIQDFISKDTSELDELKHNIWIMPTKSEVDSYYGVTSYSIESTTYFTGKLNGNNTKSKKGGPKLQLVYTVLQ